MPMNGPKFTEHQIASALVYNKGNYTNAARLLGCTRRTITGYVAKSKNLQALVARLRESHVDLAEKSLQDKVAEGNIAAIIFTLKTLGRNRGYVERVEHEQSGEVMTTVKLPEDWPGK